ncbi:hypothetical protein ACIRSU_00185 [Streptomyces sp. NPDC101160]|uniref:hypothetical protein n=1 Tax=Streptomyces sp. NPDC101160 TaxID=3366118 RepID=UPI0038140C73
MIAEESVLLPVGLIKALETGGFQAAAEADDAEGAVGGSGGAPARTRPDGRPDVTWPHQREGTGGDADSPTPAGDTGSAALAVLGAEVRA